MRWARGLFFLNAAIWLVFGIVTLIPFADAMRIGGDEDGLVTAMVVTIVVVVFGNAGAMALSGALLGKRRSVFYLFALVVLAGNVVLTITDLVSAFQWITLAIDLLLAGILLVENKQFTGG